MQSTDIKNLKMSISDMLGMHIEKKVAASIFYLKAAKKSLFFHELE